MTYEVTPWYVRRPWTARRIKNIFPNIKLIVVLRNPVDRTYSHYHLSKQSNENREFRKVIEEDMENISDAEEEPESDAADADVEGAEIADNGADEIIEGDDAEGAEIADNGADEIIEGDNAEAAAVDDPSDNNI